MHLQKPSKELERELAKDLPDWVKGVSLRESTDEEGNTVWLVFLGVAPGSDVVSDAEKLWEARETVARAFEEWQIDSWPYVRFEELVES